MGIRFDTKTKGKLRNTILEAFPDADVDDDTLDALAVGLHASDLEMPDGLVDLDLRNYKAEIEAVHGTLVEGEHQIDRASVPSHVRYYWGEARHARKTPAGFKRYTGRLPLVRVTLPDAVPEAVKTPLGHVLPDDHLLATVKAANQKYAAELGWKMDRLDVVSPPRQAGARFAAVSVMLGYKKRTDAVPSCYILEAGMATGQPKVLYLGKDLPAVIDKPSGYRPTPFACPDHRYTGTLTLDGDSPEHLTITSNKVVNGKNLPEYIQVDVAFREQRGKRLKNIWAGFLLARAVAIVMTRVRKGVPRDCPK